MIKKTTTYILNCDKYDTITIAPEGYALTEDQAVELRDELIELLLDTNR